MHGAMFLLMLLMPKNALYNGLACQLRAIVAKVAAMTANGME